MTSTPAAETPSPPLRMWRGWDASEETPEPRPRERGLDHLDAPELIERFILTVPEASRSILTRYLAHKRAQGLKHNSLKGTAGALAKFARALETTGTAMDQANEDEISLALTRLREGLSPTSHQLHVTHVRAFYRWLNDGDLPRAVARAAPRDNHAPDAAGPTLSTDDFLALVAACEDSRDASETRNKAMLWLLWDAGLTRSKLLSLHQRDVHIDADGSITLHFGARTRQAPTMSEAHRAIRLAEAAPYLRAWLAIHPHPHDTEASLWPSPEDPREPILPGGLNATLARLSQRAGLPLVSPKRLRDARIGRAVADGWHETRMRSYFGWTPTSTRPSRFTAPPPA